MAGSLRMAFMVLILSDAIHWFSSPSTVGPATVQPMSGAWFGASATRLKVRDKLCPSHLIDQTSYPSGRLRGGVPRICLYCCVDMIPSTENQSAIQESTGQDWKEARSPRRAPPTWEPIRLTSCGWSTAAPSASPNAMVETLGLPIPVRDYLALVRQNLGKRSALGLFAESTVAGNTPLFVDRMLCIRYMCYFLLHSELSSSM